MIIDPPDEPTQPEELRTFLTTPIPSITPIPFVFSVRRCREHPHTRFYLYSQNCENLLICASLCRKTDFSRILSMNSLEFLEDDSPWTIGQISGSLSEQIFIATSYFPLSKSHNKNSIRIELSQKEKNGFVFIPIPDQNDESCILTNPPNPQTTLTLLLRGFSCIYNNFECFQLKKLDDMEYLLFSSSPLSIFQAFCLTLVLCTQNKSRYKQLKQ